MQKNPQQTTDVEKLSNAEVVDLLKFYNLYAVSNGGDKNALVVSGKEMMAQIKKRLAPPLSVDRKPTEHAETSPNKLDII